MKSLAALRISGPAGEDLRTLPDLETSTAGLSTEYQCDSCRDTGWIRVQVEGVSCVKACSCREKAKHARILAKLEPRFQEATFANFVPRNDRQARAAERIAGDPHRSFFLCGAYGSGKTHLMVAQYRELASVKPCEFRVARDLLEELRRVEVGDEQASPVLAKANRGGFHLFLDDLEKIRKSEFRNEVLFHLVDTLYRKQAGLSITSNFDLAELAKQDLLPAAAVRRIDEMCELVVL